MFSNILILIDTLQMSKSEVCLSKISEIASKKILNQNTILGLG